MDLELPGPQVHSILKPGWSANAFAASGTPSSPKPSPTSLPNKSNPFPERRIRRRNPSTEREISNEDLVSWAKEVDLVIGPLIPTEEDKFRVLRLIHAYRHLNGTDLTDLPPTDMIVHRVRLAPGTKPVSHAQRRWRSHTEWWLRKLVQDGIKGGVYELAQPANGRLSQWGARAVIVDKVENPKPTDEPRLTFDYSKVTEELPGTFMELSSRVHDNLSNPRHKSLFSADLKHAYYIIGMHQRIDTTSRLLFPE